MLGIIVTINLVHGACGWIGGDGWGVIKECYPEEKMIEFNLKGQVRISWLINRARVS